MNIEILLDEIAKQDMVQEVIGNPDGSYTFVWSPNVHEQLEAAVEEMLTPPNAGPTRFCSANGDTWAIFRDEETFGMICVTQEDNQEKCFYFYTWAKAYWFKSLIEDSY